MKTSLGLILQVTAKTPAPKPMTKPDVDGKLLVRKGINPSKQRKGKSGELPRGR